MRLINIDNSKLCDWFLPKNLIPDIEKETFVKFTKTIILTMLACASPALAQTAPPVPPPEARENAMAYVKAVTTRDLYEISSSEIAVQKSQNVKVRKFASKLINDHQKSMAMTMKVAVKSGLNPSPPMLDAGFKASVNELQNASALNLDGLYLGQQISAHRAAFGLSSYYANAGDEPTLQRSAKKRSGTINRHLSTANKLLKDISDK